MVNTPTPIDGTLRKFALRIPPVISQCSGITIFGKLYRSIVFSTDLAIIRNVTRMQSWRSIPSRRSR